MNYHSISVPLMLSFVLAFSSSGRAEDPSPLERYRNLKVPPIKENFNTGWQERVLLEFDIVNSEGLGVLRAALKDPNPYVRAMAARALGIRGDKESAAALALLAVTDPEAPVRVRAVESLGLLRLQPEAIELAKKDKSDAVQWVAKMSAGQLKSETNSRELMQKAFAAGIKEGQLGVAKVGQPAPDFTAYTSDGKPFQLSAAIGKKPILIYFAAFDG